MPTAARVTTRYNAACTTLRAVTTATAAIEPIVDLGGASPTAARGLVGLLVSVDVDAPVGTLARALVTDRAVLLLERDHAPRPSREIGPDVWVLHGHRSVEHRAERDGQTLN